MRTLPSPQQTCFKETRAQHDQNSLTDFADYAWLTGDEGARLIGECSAGAAGLHGQLQRLRKKISPTRAALVVQQVELRLRAEAKFGSLAKKMFFTELALQQATDLWTARYKGARCELGAAVHDYCCGIGGDLLALAERVPTTGWDRSPEIVLLAEANLRAAGFATNSRVSVGNLSVSNIKAQLPAADEVWHLDPDRRSSGRRSTKLEWHSPGPEVIERLRQAASRGLLKLAPAAEVPQQWQQEAELEWISWDRQCRQLVVWFGELARAAGKRRATVVVKTADPWAEPLVHTFVGNPGARADVSPAIGEFVYDADPAVRAAGLTGAMALEQNLTAIGLEAGYLTGTDHRPHRLLQGFQVLRQLPLRVRSLSKQLRKLGVGRLEIKKRGVDVDPEQLRKQLKLEGDQSRTLLLTRQGDREIAILALRCPAEAAVGSERITDGLTGADRSD